MWRVRFLGQFELNGPDGRIALPGSKLAAILAYLALADKPVPREQMTSLLWGSHFEEQARQNFRQALARLRKSLGGRVVSDDQTVQIQPDGYPATRGASSRW